VFKIPPTKFFPYLPTSTAINL